MLKIHSRCNLACDHCYVYEHADQTWRDRPAVMSAETVQAAADRIAEHAARHALPQVHVVLHGGEPLLVGADRLRDTLERLRRTIEPVAVLDLGMQTNGIRLNESVAEILLSHSVKVGVSLDGGAAANDRRRRYRNGAGSYEQTLRGLAVLRLPRYRTLYAGILCTIDLRNDPVAVYEALAAQEPPHLDLLLPHATWDRPPPRPGPDPTPYASWLLSLHRRWLHDGRPMPIRLFDSIASTRHGGGSGTEALGIDVGDLVVIETDGDWEQPDSMKTVAHGAAGTGLNVHAHDAEAVLATAAMRHRRSGLAGLAAQCRVCPVVAQCGGGLYAHRYRSGAGFDNPSAYCADLKALITTMNTQPQSQTRPAAAIGEVPPPWLDEFGSGPGGAPAVRALAAAQLAITRALLAHVGTGLPPGAELAAAAWPAMDALERQSPGAVADVLAHPYIRPWLATCLRPGPEDAPADLDRLADLVAAVAVRAGAELNVTVALRAGRLHLPTLGTLVLRSAHPARAVVSSGRNGFTVKAPGVLVEVGPGLADGADGWRPARTLTLDAAAVLLEDADPYRDCFDRRAASPLTDPAARAWSTILDKAWALVHRDAPDYAEGLRAGLRAITPLRSGSDEAMHSATARDAFGAIGVAYTADSAALAVMLVHEFQHSKLGAILDLQDLTDPADRRTFAVGWRDDPRPLEGVLQGTYAHLAVADMWRARARRDRSAAPVYRMYRDWTAAALGVLQGSGSLTAAGERFAEALAGAIDRWGD
ncbi:FxsB family cyclophane-forming radical SAM/SPASM peptide maturase [Dactylosporangium sp. CA-139114]|uniref:FxsB family cyclophane-forming radical SAM/SPASM peptide maturase n=1 Tax=Dactylosporangium sp. CA-139114 TaxID=3239931 RepID=UPI003D96AC6F